MSVFKKYKTILTHTPKLHVLGKKIIGFDLDGTIIKTRSGKKFPNSTDDWVWWCEGVKKKLLDISTTHQIVIFTNQAGIGNNPTRKDVFIKKISAILNEMGIPIPVFISTTADNYRKPSVGMWRVFLKYYKIVAEPGSMFVGDAAGREHDFSNSDLCFALNCGLEFKTPEEFFLGYKCDYTPPPLPSSLLPTPKLPKRTTQPEVIILVGPPACGKSTLAKSVFGGYTHVNRDELKTQLKCLEVTKQALEAGKSVVIDNLNLKRESRAQYIELAKKYGYPVRGFVVKVPKSLIAHLNVYRSKISSRARIQPVVYRSYNKYYEPLDVSEQFDEIGEITPEFKFTENELIIFNQYA